MMSDTAEILDGIYFFRLASTNPFQPTKKYAADGGSDAQILLKPGPEFQTEAWVISPVKTEPNTYLITKPSMRPSPGFMPDTKFEKVILGYGTVKWIFNRVPNEIQAYFIRPVDHPGGVGVGYYLGANAAKDGVVIDRVPVIANPHPPAWELLPLADAE